MRWLVARAAAVLICPLLIPLSARQPDPTGTPEPAEHLFYQVVLFGGLDERYRVHNDTWSWDGSRWHKLADDGPPARSHHRMAFDRGSERMVPFGGLANGRPSRPLGDTWLWNGSSWTPSAATGPSPRSGQMMTYDDRRRGVVLVRGGSYDGKQVTRYDDIWAWTDRWTMIR